jgi:hypothetical protein
LLHAVSSVGCDGLQPATGYQKGKDGFCSNKRDRQTQIVCRLSRRARAANLVAELFFSSSSHLFLGPLFPRTEMLARCSAATRAAALLHDERIGVGNVYHLFRLPEDVEQALHRALQEPSVTTPLKAVVAERQAAVEYLRTIGSGSLDASAGPVRVGELADLRTPSAWATVASLFVAGFEQNVEVFPYFADPR